LTTEVTENTEGEFLAEARRSRRADKPVRRRGPLVGTVNIVFAKTIPVMTSMPLLAKHQNHPPAVFAVAP
jgi:hypothetical protein